MSAGLPFFSLRRRCGALFLLLCLLVGVAGCSPRQLVVSSLADELAAESGGNEDDPELARDAAPFWLKLAESVLRLQPDHRELATAVGKGFASYAQVFLVYEADRIEAQDLHAATHLRQRAAGLFRRGRDHALAALEAHHPGFLAALADPDPARRPQLTAADLGPAYWAAAAWGGWIAQRKDDPDIVADLPLAVRLASMVHLADPAWGKGAAASLRATFEAARPGGDRRQAEAWFDQAIALSNGQSAAVLVAKAEGIALPAGDRVQFEALLRRAVQAEAGAQDGDRLEQRVMQQRAAWLLTQAPDLF